MSATVVALHTAKGRRLPMRPHDEVEVEAGLGIVGDRYHGTRHRHVTVQSVAALAEAAERFGAEVPWELTRRNVTVDGLDAIPTQPGTLLRIGDVVLEAVRVAAPCKLLDDTIGTGAQEALRRRGGTCFRVLESGTVAIGDRVEVG